MGEGPILLFITAQLKSKNQWSVISSTFEKRTKNPDSWVHCTRIRPSLTYHTAPTAMATSAAIRIWSPQFFHIFGPHLLLSKMHVLKTETLSHFYPSHPSMQTSHVNGPLSAALRLCITAERTQQPRINGLGGQRGKHGVCYDKGIPLYKSNIFGLFG